MYKKYLIWAPAASLLLGVAYYYSLLSSIEKPLMSVLTYGDFITITLAIIPFTFTTAFTLGNVVTLGTIDFLAMRRIQQFAIVIGTIVVGVIELWMAGSIKISLVLALIFLFGTICTKLIQERGKDRDVLFGVAAVLIGVFAAIEFGGKTANPDTTEQSAYSITTSKETAQFYLISSTEKYWILKSASTEKLVLLPHSTIQKIERVAK